MDEWDVGRRVQQLESGRKRGSSSELWMVGNRSDPVKCEQRLTLYIYFLLAGMNDQSNRVYVEGLTRFETRGRSVTAIPSNKPDHMPSRQPIRNPADIHKRMDLEMELKRIREDGRDRINRNEKDLMSRSTDRFLQKGNSVFGEKSIGLDYLAELRGAQGPNYGISQGAYPVQHTGDYSGYKRPVLDKTKERLDRYEQMGRLGAADRSMYDVGARMGKLEEYSDLHRDAHKDISRDIHRDIQRQIPRDFSRDVAREMPRGYDNMDILRREAPMRSPEKDIRARMYGEDLGGYKNLKTLNVRVGENKYDPRVPASDFKEDFRREDLMRREFGRDLNRNYLQGMGRDFEKNYDRQITRKTGKDYLNMDYPKDRPSTGLASKHLDLEMMRMGDLPSYAGREHKREAEGNRMSRFEGMRSNYENMAQQERRDPVLGYRKSLRGDY